MNIWNLEIGFKLLRSILDFYWNVFGVRSFLDLDSFEFDLDYDNALRCAFHRRMNTRIQNYNRIWIF